MSRTKSTALSLDRNKVTNEKNYASNGHATICWCHTNSNLSIHDLNGLKGIQRNEIIYNQDHQRSNQVNSSNLQLRIYSCNGEYVLKT